MKKILVTGAVGQVGRFLVRRLIKEKENFIALDKRNYVEFPEIKILHAEITNNEDLKKYSSKLDDVDVIIHLASLITNDKDVIKSGPSSIDLNIKGTLNLLEVLPNLKHICFASTYMVYGTPIANPVTEEHPTNPNVVYGASKLATEKYLQIYAKEQKINLTILRLMGIYNVERPFGQAIPSFIKMIAEDQSPTILGNGKICRNHLYIDDAIESFFASIKNPKSGIFNIGGTESPSNLELIKIINEIMEKDVKPIFKETKNPTYDFVTDISKAKKEIDFIPKVGIKEGIKKTIERYFESGW